MLRGEIAALVSYVVLQAKGALSILFFSNVDSLKKAGSPSCNGGVSCDERCLYQTKRPRCVDRCRVAHIPSVLTCPFPMQDYFMSRLSFV